jgi:hypothetical protein
LAIVRSKRVLYIPFDVDGGRKVGLRGQVIHVDNIMINNYKITQAPLWVTSFRAVTSKAVMAMK